MLNTHRAIATLAVQDIAQARRFYEDVLGLQPVAGEGDELVSYRSGDSLVNVYRSKYAGTNQATAVTFVVGQRIDDEVAALKARGVRFEHYELPGLKREGDVHVGGQMRVAWFKDPDGNILNLVTG
jgi:catechol 2,3-dioxygenase-like lactoylglutathione lyase family enzyme